MPPRAMWSSLLSPPMSASPAEADTIVPPVPLLLRAMLGHVGTEYPGCGRRRPAAKGVPRRQLPAGMRGEPPTPRPLATPRGVEATRCYIHLAGGVIATPMTADEEDQGAAWTSPPLSGAAATLEEPEMRRSGGARPAGPAPGMPTVEPPRASTFVRRLHTAACAVVVLAAIGPPPNPHMSTSG